MYDDISRHYHLIFQDWEASMAWQGNRLQQAIRSLWGEQANRVLDLSCGIGTQTLALAREGFAMTASDLSANSVARARQEAAKRELTIPISVCDMLQAHAHHGSDFDVVISCDNAVPHLLDDASILEALQQMYACLRAGGGVLLSLRDYEDNESRKDSLLPYGLREQEGKTYAVFQTRKFHGDHYDVALYFVEESDPPVVWGGRSTYYAVSLKRVMTLMETAGFRDVRRLDEAFYQPLLTATKPA